MTSIFKNRQRNPAFNQVAGFTLIELIIAMAIFALLLLLITSGIIQIMRIYQSGVASRRTQAAGRLTMETITRDVRSSINATAATDEICLEGSETVRYQRTANDSLVRQPLNGDCASGTDDGSPTIVIDGAGNTQLRQFDNVTITDENGDPASVQITLVVTTGVDDLFGGTACLPGQGAHFCSSTQFTNAVSLRGVN